MKTRFPMIAWWACGASWMAAVAMVWADPVKVFILAGQSNMEGHGLVEADSSRNDGKGTLAYMADNNPQYGFLRKGSNGWKERDDVWLWSLGRKGPLAPGYGARDGRIGPEFGFGQVLGDALDAPVLLIKTAWGGKSLAVDFRPPSSGGEVGPYYREMLQHVRSVLGELSREFPKLRDGYEIAGFGWHQGWNDGCSMPMCQEYEENMKNFIRDVRKDLAVDSLPFVIADSGFGGKRAGNDRRLMIREAQAAPAKTKEFKGTVACVETAEFWRTEDESPSKQGYHWNNNGETYYLIGEAMGKAMLEMLGQPGSSGPEAVREYRSADGSQTFSGQLLRYDDRSGKVTIRRAGGRPVTFDLGMLHPDDQTYVKSR